MGHKEYSVTNIIDILRRAKAQDSIRRIARSTGIDRNTIRNYFRLAAVHGFSDIVPDEQLADIAATVSISKINSGNMTDMGINISTLCEEQGRSPLK